LVIHAGLDGIEKNLALAADVNEDLYMADQEITRALTSLPRSLREAVDLAKKSEFIPAYIGAEVFGRYIALKEQEIGGEAHKDPGVDPHHGKHFRTI
jgi:glutamine synthetase